MAINSNITDSASGLTATVTFGGALAVSPLKASLSFNETLAVDDTAVNIVPAMADNIFCITGIFLTGNKNIDATTAATVNIYTASSATAALSAAIETLLTVPVAKNTRRDLNPILLTTDIGEYINGETSDDDVIVTILGFYLKERE